MVVGEIVQQMQDLVAADKLASSRGYVDQGRFAAA
jgi:hypothetical protein